MTSSKADTIAQLKRELLPLQGFKSLQHNAALDAALGIIKNGFAQKSFPLAAVHEFVSNSAEGAACTAGFVGGLLSPLLQKDATAIWISTNRNIFPPALKGSGVAPHQIIFIHLKKEKDILWVMEESLKCAGLAAVVAEMQELSFTSSRRLQLAVEQSQVTGFVLRMQPRSLAATACVTRWQITPLPSELSAGMPGVGFPRCNVALQKVRNGKPGLWQVECGPTGFRLLSRLAAVLQVQQKKTG